MLRRGWPLCVLLAGCAGGDDEALSSLDGTWAGALEDGATTVSLVAEFEWSGDDELLFGTVSAYLFSQTLEPRVFAVRRWDTHAETVSLDLTDEVDPTSGLDLDGTVDGDEFLGAGSLSYSCPGGKTCGYAGDFALTRTAAPVTSPTSETGQNTP